MCLNKKKKSIRVFWWHFGLGMPAGASEGQGTSSWDSPQPISAPSCLVLPSCGLSLEAGRFGALTFAEEAVYFVCLHKLLDSQASFVLHLRSKM